MTETDEKSAIEISKSKPVHTKFNRDKIPKLFNLNL